jgi:hypothetical protein
MQIKSLFHYLWKLPLCGLAFFVGFALGSQLAAGMGLAAPDIPAGADQATLFQLTAVSSLILALVLAWLSPAISGGFVIRWLSLFFLAWIAHGVNNYLEAAIFSTMSAASVYTVVFYFPPFLLLGAIVAWLFPPAMRGESFFNQTRTYFAGRTAGAWVWRLLAAFLVFPLIYYLVGSLIAPLVIDYYRQGVSELALPGWDQILPVLFLRSFLFLIACLPVLICLAGVQPPPVCGAGPGAVRLCGRRVYAAGPLVPAHHSYRPQPGDICG